MYSLITKNIIKNSVSRLLSGSVAAAKQHLDPLQESALEECCLLVDLDDNVIGHASKKECHLVKPDGTIPLHRAFSVFLFTNKEELILQKRASQKVTYPDHYTNTCCSHPIADVIGEDEEQNALGIKRAAQRRLNYELGIPIESIPINKFTYLTRIHYMDIGNGVWGEHEIDYILFLQGDFTMKPNSNEVSEISYIPKDAIVSFLPTLNAPLTPWFSLILQHRLKLWWNNLNDLKQFQDHEKILSLGQCLV